jgi:hypothetical protein
MFDTKKLTVDPHCYECKVKYRDPRPRDLVMFLHAWTYSVKTRAVKRPRPLFTCLFKVCLDEQ